METCKITIPGRLPGLNDYTRACRSNPRAGAKMKRDAEQEVMYAIATERVHGLPSKLREPVVVRFRYFEANKRRDKDNIAGFAQKVVLDALVRVGLISDDGWGHVDRIEHAFDVDRERPRIEVELEEAGE